METARLNGFVYLFIDAVVLNYWSCYVITSCATSGGTYIISTTP